MLNKCLMDGLSLYSSYDARICHSSMKAGALHKQDERSLQRPEFGGTAIYSSLPKNALVLLANDTAPKVFDLPNLVVIGRVAVHLDRTIYLQNVLKGWCWVDDLAILQDT